MSEYAIINGQLVSDDELKHYGVLGMKWGIRRGRSVEAMGKASKKLEKYDRKATKKLNKAVRKKYGMFGSQKRYEKAKLKADKAVYKGQKWYKKMEKEFSKQKVVQISKHDREIGEKFAKYFAQKADFK